MVPRVVRQVLAIRNRCWLTYSSPLWALVLLFSLSLLLNAQFADIVALLSYFESCSAFGLGLGALSFRGCEGILRKCANPFEWQC